MADKCPVPHKSTTEGTCPVPAPEPQDKCPIDHSTREAWVQNIQVTVPEAIETDGCDSTQMNQSLEDQTKSNTLLPIDREISSIPRTNANSNWIYPSQKQFFEAMQRKKWDPNAEDMKTVVPIHNVVNEQTWHRILMWESSNLDAAEAQCGGITLTSFKGDSKKLTPRAWFKSSVLGQAKPFDRHDWRINRCGVEVDYVIDFYGNPQGVELDVRPKLNSWQGVKLRLGRALGWN